MRPEFRGRGPRVAGLPREVREGARLRTSPVVEVLDWNEPAVRCYKGLGAVRMDDWTSYRVAGNDLEELAAGS